MTTVLDGIDSEIAALIRRETRRLEQTIDLIAAESHAAAAIFETLGSVLTTKTIEGYPGKRFHAGCTNADQIEALAVARAKKLFRAEHANVQPLGGTAANLAVYFSVLEIGDRVLAMQLSHGGHLSHGHRASITSRCFQFEHYGVDPDTECIDYERLREQAVAYRPKMIVAGASAYPQLIDYRQIAEIAKDVSAYLMADMAHIAGLVAAEVIPSPVPYCDFVTFTCYKTMMGGRGGVILCRRRHAAHVDRAVFPGCQGTSAVNAIAAKAVAFQMAAGADFVKVQKSTLANARRLAFELERRGYRIVTGGTCNHQVLVDVSVRGLSGHQCETVLETAGIITNRNVIPGDADTTGRVSGIRLGTSAVSARGMGPADMGTIAHLIDAALTSSENPARLQKVTRGVRDLCRRFPLRLPTPSPTQAG